MRKISISLLAAAGLVLTSCSNEDLQLSGNGYQDGKVSFTVEMPGNIGTRAMADGLSAKQLTYVVYDNSGNFLFQEEINDAFNAKVADVNIPLVNGKTYKVAFFAKNETAPYTITDGELSIDYAGATANNDIYDAFYAVQEVSVSAGMPQQNVTLKRPFGQLNVGAADWADAKKAGYIVENTALSFTADVYTTMNLLNGEVGGKQGVTFAMHALPDVQAGPTPVKLNIDSAPNVYDYMASAYVLMGSDQSIVSTVTFTYAGPQGNVDVPVNTVPMQRNYRTNILGNFFTTNVAYHIVIDQEFDTPDLEPALTVEATGLKAAIHSAQSGAVIAVGPGNITQELLGLNSSLVNGKDITIIGTPASSSYGKAQLTRGEEDCTYFDFSEINRIYEGRIAKLNGIGNVTFKNIKVKSLTENYNGFHSAASITYDNCVIEGTLSGYTKEKYIGCTFNYPSQYAYWTYGSPKVSFDGCKFNSNEAAKSRAILVYSAGATTVDITVENTIFNGVADSGDKCAIEIHTELGLNGSLTVNNCTVNGNGWLDENGGLWREVDNYKGDNGEPTLNFNVFVNGVQVQYRLEKGSEGQYLVNNPQIFKHVLTNLVNTSTAPVVVEIQGDIDMSGVEYKHSDLGYIGPHPSKHITINGNGHTISNLEVSGLQATLIPWTSQGFTINNLNIKDSSFTGNNSDDEYSCAAAFGAFCDYSPVYVNNCTLDNITVGNAKYVGGFVAYNSNSVDTAIVEFDGCLIKNSRINSAFTKNGISYQGHAGAYVGLMQGGVIQNCGVENVTFNVKGDRGGIFVGTSNTASRKIGTGNWIKGVVGLSKYVGYYDNGDDNTNANVEVRD